MICRFLVPTEISAGTGFESGPISCTLARLALTGSMAALKLMRRAGDTTSAPPSTTA